MNINNFKNPLWKTVGDDWQGQQTRGSENELRSHHHLTEMFPNFLPKYVAYQSVNSEGQVLSLRHLAQHEARSSVPSG